MPYRTTLDKVKLLLKNNDNKLNGFLLTDKNLYSISHKMTEKEIKDMVGKSLNFINENYDYFKFNPTEIKKGVIYYLSKKEEEYKSLEKFKLINEQIINDKTKKDRISEINKKEKIKLVIFKLDTVLFLYRYNTSKLFEQGFWIKFINKEEPIIEKNNYNILILDKNNPDIIFDLENELALLLNVTQAEYILDINKLFNNSIQQFKNLNLMSINTIDEFLSKINSSSRYTRKLHKIQTEKTYQYFQNNKDKVDEVIAEYKLCVSFDKNTGEIIFDENTEIIDVLRLLSDDYVKRLISDKKDIID